MTDLGGLSARLSLNTTGLVTGRTIAQGELLKVEGAMLKTEAASTRLGGAFSRLGVGAKLLTGVLGLELARKAGEGLKVATAYAVDLEATMARTRRVFGDSTDVVVKFADTADQKLGRTKDQALTASVRFGTLATRLGETKAQAAATSIALTKLGTDLAASKGGSVDSADNALATGLVGRGMALRRYGIVLTDTSLKEEAVKEGLMRSTKDALTPAIKLQAAYNVIMRQTADVQGYFEGHLDLIANKQKVAAATTTSASEALGKALIPAERMFADLLANDVAPALKGAGEAAGWISDHQFGRDMTLVGGGLLIAVKGATALHKAFSTLRDETSAIFGHGAARDAITEEGLAAERTAGQLDILALAEKRAGAAALLAAEDEAVLAAASRALPRPTVPIPGTPRVAVPPGASTKPGLPQILGGGVGLVLGTGIVYAVSQVQNEDAHLKGLGQQVAAGKGLSAAELTKQASDLGVSAGSAPGSYIFDPTRDRNDITAGVKLLAEIGKATTKASSLLRLSPIEAATANLVSSRSGLIAARKYARDPNVQQQEAGLVGGALGGTFDTLPVTTGDLNAIASANISVANAQARVDKFRAGSGSASPASLASAQAAVLSAEDTLRRHKGDTTAQTLRLQAAEDRLNTLRAGGKVNTKGLAVAEAQLELARKKAGEASKGTALSAGDLLGRIGGQLAHTRGLAADSEKLIKLGVTRPILEQIDALEKTAPGTLHKVAQTMTRSIATSLAARNTDLVIAQHDFLTAPLRIAIEQAKTENDKRLKDFAAAQRRTYANALRGVGDPTTGLLLGSTPAPTGNGPATLEKSLGFGSSTTTVYQMPNATIVANDPAAMARELERRARVSALAGMGQ